MRHAFLEAARRRLAIAREPVSNETRPLAPIIGEAVRVRTLHPPAYARRELIDGATQPMMLDAIVTITLPRIGLARGIPSTIVRL